MSPNGRTETRTNRNFTYYRTKSMNLTMHLRGLALPFVFAAFICSWGCGKDRTVDVTSAVGGARNAAGAVPAGPILTPELKADGWTTSSEFPPEGSSRALKGGAIRIWGGNFPP